MFNSDVERRSTGLRLLLGILGLIGITTAVVLWRSPTRPSVPLWKRSSPAEWIPVGTSSDNTDWLINSRLIAKISGGPTVIAFVQSIRGGSASTTLRTFTCDASAEGFNLTALLLMEFDRIPSSMPSESEIPILRDQRLPLLALTGRTPEQHHAIRVLLDQDFGSFSRKFEHWIINPDSVLATARQAVCYRAGYGDIVAPSAESDPH